MRVEDRCTLRMRRRLAGPLGLLLVTSFAGCSTNGLVGTDDGHLVVVPLISRVTNLSDPACKESFSQQLAAALVKQGETAEAASEMSKETMNVLSYSQSPSMFYAFSPSDLRYGFFVQNRKEGCALRLVERQKKILGRTATFQNGIKDYATGRLAGCSCSENELPPDED
ncbi:MAG TPA: hypothetical protein VLX28_15090 [Thermoanaerobaculia bacterium]|nr:hypothetical protein [Thermoanaerobaculia bacterium]